MEMSETHLGELSRLVQKLHEDVDRLLVGQLPLADHAQEQLHRLLPLSLWYD